MNQKPSIIDITEYWEISSPYSEGSRSKFEFQTNGEEKELEPNTKHLFKKSRNRAPWEFWIEYIACEIGKTLDINTPKVYLGKCKEDSQYQYGTIIEWFHSKEKEEIFFDGGKIFRTIVKDFDNKKGKQHSLQLTKHFWDNYEIFGKSPKHLWGEFVGILIFDTIIGNTDRHQENWGFIINEKNNNLALAPAFDNGTSLGYNIQQQHLEESSKKIDNFIEKGYHHIRNANCLDSFNLNQTLEYKYTKFKHLELIEHLLKENKNLVLEKLKKIIDIYNIGNIEKILKDCILCMSEEITNEPYSFTKERKSFIKILIEERFKKLKYLYGQNK